MGLQIGRGITIANSVEINFIYPESPINLIPPIINGPIVTGSNVTVTNGYWTGVPPVFTYEYQWVLNSSNVPNATSNTFFLTDAMAGDNISAIVTATNVIGNASASTPTYSITDWGPGSWTVSNTGLTTGTGIFDSTNNYIYQMTTGSALSRSLDGVTWANITIPFSAASHILQANNRVIIWKSGTNRAAYSTNEGTSWANSNITVNTTTNLLSGAFDGANIVIIRGDPASNNFVRSTDLGNTWSNVNTGYFTNFTKDIAYGNGIFMTVGTYANALYNTSKISNDGGVTWTPVTHVYGDSIAYGNGRFVAVRSFGGSAVPGGANVTTDNGNTWYSANIPNQTWRTVVYADTHFVASEDGGNIIYSIDGINWSSPYSTIPSVQAGSSQMTYLASKSLLLNGGVGTAGNSLYVTHTTVPAPIADPNQPTNVVAVSSSATTATVTWTAPASAGTTPIINYKVQAISVNGAPTVTQYTVGTETTLIVTGLVTGKTYYFNVSAINTGGEGPFGTSQTTTQILPNLLESYGGGYAIKVTSTYSIIVAPNSTGSTSDKTWSSAIIWAGSLNIGGYTDWVVPVVTTMQLINQYLDTVGYTAGYYWTLTPAPGGPPAPYYILRMPEGTISSSSTLIQHSVRATRTQYY
jgi:hypothetical protein